MRFEDSGSDLKNSHIPGPPAMTLLRQLQNDAVNATVDIVTLLRKARILAARLRNSEFESWIKYEMNGYPENVETPAYRVIGVHAKAHLIIGRMQVTAADVMVSQLPERYQVWGMTCHLRHSVSELASLVAGLDSGQHGGLICPWPQELAVCYGGSGYGDGMSHVQCIRAWQEISGAEVVSVIETVRNKLLEFVLEIEAEAPDAGEAAPGAEPVPQDRITQIFHTNVYGGTAHVAEGGTSNAITVGTMQRSQIEQAGADSALTAALSFGAQERLDLEALLREISGHFTELDLDERREQGKSANRNHPGAARR